MRRAGDAGCTITDTGSPTVHRQAAPLYIHTLRKMLATPRVRKTDVDSIVFEAESRSAERGASITRAQIQHELGVRQDAESAALPLVFGVVETLRAQCVHDRGAAEDARALVGAWGRRCRGSRAVTRARRGGLRRQPRARPGSGGASSPRSAGGSCCGG